MNTVKYVLLGSFVVGAVVLAFLGWMNRAAERVQVNVATVVVLGVATAVVSLLFSLEAETRETAFPVIFLFDRQTKIPFMARDLSLEHAMVRQVEEDIIGEIEAASPGVTKTIEGETLYRDILVYRILDAWPSWGRVSLSRTFDVPDSLTGGGALRVEMPHGAVAVDDEQLRAMFPNNVAFKCCGRGFPLHLPPHTSMVVGSQGSIIISNPFLRLRVSIGDNVDVRSRESLVLPLHLLGLPLAQARVDALKYQSVLISVTLRATFDPLRSGHPRMPSYKAWVAAVFDVLTMTLDSERYWRKAREAYVVRHLGALSEAANESGRR